MANVIVSQQIWDNKLAQRLDKPTNWKETCDVLYSDTQVLVLPYISTGGEPAVATNFFTTVAGRSTLTNIVTSVAVTISTETLSIITTDYDSVYIDYADQAQSNYARIADLGDLLGKKVNERVEAITLANYNNWTDFGDTGGGVLGLASTPFTVTSGNIDDLVRGIVEQITTANAYDLYKQNGGFVTWRPNDWTLMTQFMQANGFAYADQALKNGGMIGIDYMGLYHYVSTSHTAGHVMAGVRKVQRIGVLRSTFGRSYITETPASSGGNGILSGTQIHHRLDYGLIVQTNVKPAIYDVNVN